MTHSDQGDLCGGEDVGTGPISIGGSVEKRKEKGGQIDQTCWVVAEQAQVYAVTVVIIQPAVSAGSPAAVSCSVHPGGKTNKTYKFKKTIKRKGKKEKNDCDF